MVKIKNSVFGLLVVAGLALLAQPALAQNLIPEAEIAALKAEIVELKKQITLLESKLAQVNEPSLKLGDQGPKIKLIQEILATDPEIYPEALATGYYGPLTAKALRKFQDKWGTCVFADDGETTDSIDANGKIKHQLKPKTVARINQLLLEGAGSSGKVPPGLLKAPGIKAKFCRAGIEFPVATTTPPASTSTPPAATSTADTLAPVISAIKVNKDDDSAEIRWKTNEKASGKLWYSLDSALDVSATSTSLISDMNLTKEHEVDLTGLASSTTYYYKIMATDKAGNAASTTVRSFETED